MKSNELRMGNIVTQEGRLINGITTLTIHKFDLGSVVLNPIPLTEEWLVKLGFELHSEYDYKNYKTKNGFYISMWNCTFPVAGFEEKGVCYWGDGYLPVRHVHHLQNLYFALTGQELVTSSL